MLHTAGLYTKMLVWMVLTFSSGKSFTEKSRTVELIFFFSHAKFLVNPDILWHAIETDGVG